MTDIKRSNYFTRARKGYQPWTLADVVKFYGGKPTEADAKTEFNIKPVMGKRKAAPKKYGSA